MYTIQRCLDIDATSRCSHIYLFPNTHIHPPPPTHTQGRGDADKERQTHFQCGTEHQDLPILDSCTSLSLYIEKHKRMQL